MASIAPPLQTLISTRCSATSRNPSLSRFCAASSTFASSNVSSCKLSGKRIKNRVPLTIVAAVGDVSSEGTTYLIAGAIAVALVGTGFPILFSRKDVCPECDGAGFVRKSGVTLRANAARKDQAQIVCARCNGLGKLNQIDK